MLESTVKNFKAPNFVAVRARNEPAVAIHTVAIITNATMRRLKIKDFFKSDFVISKLYINAIPVTGNV